MTCHKRHKKITRSRRVRKMYNIRRNNFKRDSDGKATTSKEVPAEREVQEQE